MDIHRIHGCVQAFHQDLPRAWLWLLEVVDDLGLCADLFDDCAFHCCGALECFRRYGGRAVINSDVLLQVLSCGR